MRLSHVLCIALALCVGLMAGKVIGQHEVARVCVGLLTR